MKFSGTITIQYSTLFSPFQPEEYREGLDWLAENHFDGAELCISDYRTVDVEKIRQELAERGLGCSTISTGQARALEDISLLHQGEALSKAQERLKQHIDAASVLKSKVTLGLLRGLGTPGKEQEDKGRLARNLDPVFDYAQQKGVMILLEAINRYETSLFNSAASVMDFLEKDMGNPRCAGVLWDLFHANIEDAQFSEAIDRMGEKLCHVHMADSNRMFPGYGHIDFFSVVKELKKTNYQEYLSFECLNQPSLAVVRNESGRWIQTLREL